MSHEKIAMVPARYAATRFPAKLMQLLGEKTVILHPYNNTVATGLFDEVMVVTDNEIIYNEIVVAAPVVKAYQNYHHLFDFLREFIICH